MKPSQMKAVTWIVGMMVAGLLALRGADVPPGSACRGRCEADVAAVNLVIQRSKTAYQKTGGAYRRNAYWMLAMGIIFTVLGIAPMIMGRGYATAFVAVMGVLFLYAAVSNFRNSREISSSD